MSKPLLRWTIGDCSNDGLSVFAESLRWIKRALGSRFDYLICSNTSASKATVEMLAESQDIPVLQVSWASYPLPEGTCPPNPMHRQGSFWKICPPRMRPDAHEIIIDNDVVIRRCPPQFDEFLSSNKPLISTEACNPYSKYYKFIDSQYGFNSGVIGLPPGFDFGSHLLATWERCGAMSPLLSWDEQGLIGVTLTQFPFIMLPHDVIVPLLKGGQFQKAEYEFAYEDGYESKKFTYQDYKTYKFTYSEHGYHFCEVNRIPVFGYPLHIPWHDYCIGSIL